MKGGSAQGRLEHVVCNQTSRPTKPAILTRPTDSCNSLGVRVEGRVVDPEISFGFKQ